MSSRDAARTQVERGRFDKAAKLYIKSAAEHQEANKPGLALEDFENAIKYEEKSEKRKKLFDYLKDAFSFSKTHDEDRASNWAKKLIPIVKGKIADLNPNKKQKDLAKNYEYLASLFLAIDNLDEQKSALASSGDYYGKVALKKLDSKKEANVLEASSIFNQAISLYLKAERSEKVLELRFKEVGLNLSFHRLAEAESVISKIQNFIEEIPPDEKPMFLHEAFQELSKIYAREGSKFLQEKKKEEIIQIGSKYFEIAREFSSQGKATKQIPAIWVQQGTTHLEIGRIKEAFASFSSATKIAGEVNNPDALKQATQKLVKQGFNKSIRIVDNRRLDKEKIAYSTNPGAILFEKAKEIMKEMDLYKDQGSDLADRLIEVGKSIVERHQDFKTAFEYFQRPSEVLIEIEEQNRGTELANYLADLDSQLIKGQKIQQSSKYSELISKILDSFGQKNRKAELYINRAESFLAISRFEDAHLALTSASEIFLQLENTSSAEKVARTLFERGSQLIESGNSELGKPLTNDANSIYEKTKNNQIRADNFRLRAESYLKANMKLESFNDFKEAAEVFREIEDKENAIKIGQRASEVGIMLVRQKDKKLGHEICEFALEVLQDLKSDELIPEIVFQKGTAYREVGDLDKALKELNRSAEGFIALKNIERAATIADELLQISLSLISTKTLEIGQQYAESSTNIYKTIKEGKKEGLALSQIGEAFHEVGSIDKAIEILDNSIEVLRKAKEKGLLAEVYSAKGKSLKAKAHSLVPSDGQAVVDLSKMIQETFEKAGASVKGVETVDELASKLIGIDNYESGIVLAGEVADSYIKLRENESAEQALSRAAELLVAKNQVEEGINLYERSIKLLAKEKNLEKTEQLVKKVEEIGKSLIAANEVERGRRVLELLENTCEKEKLSKILGELQIRECSFFIERDELEFAEELADKAKSAFEELDTEQIAAISEGYIAISRAFANKSEMEGFRQSYEKGIAFLISENHYQQVIESCQTFAQELVGSGHFSEASEIIRRGSKLSKEQEKDGLKAGEMLSVIAKSLISQDKPDLAYSLFTEALELMDEDQKEGLQKIASEFLHVSFQFRAKNMNEQATKFFSQAEKAYAKADALLELGDSFCERTKGALENNALADAFWLAESAVNTLSKVDTSAAENPINILISHARSLLGINNDAASEIFNKSSKLLVEIDGNSKRAVELLSSEARSFYGAGDKLTASQVVANASKMLAGANEKISAGKAHSTFGSFLAENNDFHDALGEFNKGIEILADAGEEGKEEMAALSAGLFRLAKGILAGGDRDLGNKVADQAKQTTTRFQLPQTEELVAAQQDYMDAQLDAMSFTISVKGQKKKKKKKKKK
ncbi:MAG: hypothetical protein ACE5OZ_16765 [Candidatus Heimdallarchaeota archaeon]